MWIAGKFIEPEIVRRHIVAQLRFLLGDPGADAVRSLRVGAAMTALLFTAGKWLIVVYLGRIALASAYGVAGSFLPNLMACGPWT